MNGTYDLKPARRRSRASSAAVDLAAGERKRETFQLKPTEVGLTKLAVRVTGPDGIDVKRRLTFDVKVPAGDIRRMTVATLAAKGGKHHALAATCVQDLIPRRTQGDGHRRAAGARSTCPACSPRSTAIPTAAPSRRRAAPCRCSTSTTWPSASACASDTQMRERVQRRHRARVRDAGLLGRLRHLGSVRRRHVADQLRHRLPDARQGAGYTVRQQAFNQALDRLAELHQLRAGLRAAAARPGPTRSTCWPATAARRSASCATTSTPSSTTSRRRWRRPSSARRWP